MADSSKPAKRPCARKRKLAPREPGELKAMAGFILVCLGAGAYAPSYSHGCTLARYIAGAIMLAGMWCIWKGGRQNAR